MLPRDAAKERFKKHLRRCGVLKGLLIASGSVYIGLANEIGMDYLKAKETENPGNDLRERINIALEDHDHDFFHVHTKAPDEAAT